MAIVLCFLAHELREEVLGVLNTWLSMEPPRTKLEPLELGFVFLILMVLSGYFSPLPLSLSDTFLAISLILSCVFFSHDTFGFSNWHFLFVVLLSLIKACYKADTLRPVARLPFRSSFELPVLDGGINIARAGWCCFSDIMTEFSIFVKLLEIFKILPYFFCKHVICGLFDLLISYSRSRLLALEMRVTFLG